MKQRYGETEFVDQPTGFSRGDDGVFRHATVLEADESDDGDLWEKSEDSLLALKSQIEKQLEATATASCRTKQIRELYGLKLTAEKLNDELDAVMRELDRKGALPPIVKISVN